MDTFDLAVIALVYCAICLVLGVAGYLIERHDERRRHRKDLALRWREAHRQIARTEPVDALVMRHLRGTELATGHQRSTVQEPSRSGSVRT